MQIPWTLVALTAACCLMATTNKAAFPLDARTETELPTPALDEGDIQERLAQLKIPFEPRYNEEVRDLIREYTTNGFRDTEAMLGRTSFLFPIFEHYLALNGLPEELKYLPIVETSLNADARSGAGAAGLWQFIPATARQYRLRINENLDERFDPYRATEAAVEMLTALYGQYNDWQLVLAAYNCGPARVNSAIRNSGCRNFWELKDFLPYETRNYVPRFIAAAYIANFYADHGLQPRLPGMEGGIRAIKVFDAFSFSDVAYASGLSLTEIRSLNPSYRSSFIPESSRGNFLLLPAPAMEKFRDFLSARRMRRNIDPALLYPNFYKVSYVVRPGETIDGLARRFRVSVSDLMRWNHLPYQEIFVNQELVAFLPDKNYIATP